MIEFNRVRGEYDEIITWLIDNVEDVRDRETKGEYKGRPKPYHFSAISQFARFRGMTDIWYLEISGLKQNKTVKFSDQIDPRPLTEFALKWTLKNI